MNVIVGTAGHIDHGKTALVAALTGTNTDRLPEEKKRGITIDLGFAEMTCGEMHFGFVDVPGHERFVKNMLAGAGGIDVVLLVVSATEGVMPQTVEHFEICRLLDIRSGIVALTKSDIADDAMLAAAKISVAEMISGTFMASAPIIEVSSVTGHGIVELKDALADAATGLPKRSDVKVFRLPIDRSFSVKGFGAVATGTLISGKVAEGDELELLPPGQTLRVRGIQVHGVSVGEATQGSRVALNLGGIDHSKVSRGMLLAESGTLSATQIFDAQIEMLESASKPLRNRARIRVHIGTVEVLARIEMIDKAAEIEPGSSAFVQIRLESPAVVVWGDRTIIRSYSPQMTIAGGTVLDPFATRIKSVHRQRTLEFLIKLSASSEPIPTINLFIVEAGASGIDVAGLRARTGLIKDVVDAECERLVSVGFTVNANGRFIDVERLVELDSKSVDVVRAFHAREPLARGISRESLRDSVFENLPKEIFAEVLSRLEASGLVSVERDVVKLTDFAPVLSVDEEKFIAGLINIFDSAGLEVPRLAEVVASALEGTQLTAASANKHLYRLIERGDIVKVTDEFCFSRKVIDDLTAALRDRAKNDEAEIDVAGFKSLSGVSRKYAIPLLEYFDSQRVTVRRGDKRVILQ